MVRGILKESVLTPTYFFILAIDGHARGEVFIGG